jgi:hypothetical protein
MGSIQNKRGSARQAPPNVYSPFMAGPENEENDKAILAAFWIITVITGMSFAFGLFATFLEHIGLWTPD